MAEKTDYRMLLGTAALAGLAAFSTPAWAQLASDDLIVQATVGGECTMTGATLDFGTYVGQQKDVDVPISFKCNTPSNVKITLDGGNMGNPAAREMTHTGDAANPPLRYQLYMNQARNQVWGLASGQTRAFTNTRDDSPMVYGRIIGGQNRVVPGTYRDTVRITLTAD